MQAAERIHFPLRATCLAPKVNPLALGLKFRAAGGTFIQNLMQPVRTAFALDMITFFHLPFIFVLFKRLFYGRLNFLRGHAFQLFLGKQRINLRFLTDISIRVLAPLWRIEEISVRHAHHHGHFRKLAKFPDRAVQAFVDPRKLETGFGINRYR